MSQLTGIILVVIAALVGSAGPIFIKKGADKMTRQIKTIIFNRNLIIGVFFYGISSLIFIAGLRFGDVSVLYPFASTSYIWISFLSVKYLNEKMNKSKWIGISLIIVGVSLIGLGSI